MDIKKMYSQLQEMECITFYEADRSNDAGLEAVNEALREVIQVMYFNYKDLLV